MHRTSITVVQSGIRQHSYTDVELLSTTSPYNLKPRTVLFHTQGICATISLI